MESRSKSLNSISPEKRALLAHLLKERGLAPYRLLPIPRRTQRDNLPLSPAQERLWFVDQQTPSSYLYNVPVALRLKGKLNIAAFERSINEIVRRHESLRTSFVTIGGQPRQSISDTLSIPLQPFSVTHVPLGQRDKAAQALLLEQACIPFELARSPLVRASLVHAGEDEYLFLLVMHHIVTDGWSLGVFIRELATLYEAFNAGLASPLDELSIQYADYAVWQREWLDSGELQSQLDYWRNKFAGGVPELELPVDYACAARSGAGAHESITIDARVTEQLRRIARDEGVTLFMVMLAAWQVLLGRYSGQNEIVIGADMANRPRPETEKLIGFFINMLVIYGDLRGEPSFRELLRQLKQTCLEAYANQDVPFERIVKELRAGGRGPGRHPLFQVAFVLQNAPMPDDVELSGLSISGMKVDTEATPFDMVLTISEGEETLFVSFLYSTDLFKADRMRRMARHYEHVLRAIGANIEAPVWKIRLLSATEEREQLETWNRTAREFPRKSSIAEQFELQVAQRGDAEAVAYGSERLSYLDLNERANQLAHYLKEYGVGPEVVVGVSLERSVDLIVSLLGVLKAGGAYLPVDPRIPAERINYILETSQAPLVITTKSKSGEMPAWVQVVCIDDEELSTRSKENLERQSGGDNLAYVMYTSGSTGRPKGIAVTQANVLRLVHEPQYVRLDHETVMLQLASNAFDAATFEIWGALLHGARLVLFPGRLASGAELQQLIAAEGVETLWLTSALYNGLVESGVEALAGVKQLLVGGEALSVKHIRQGLAALPETEFINGYGPTEVTTFSCTHRVRQTAAEGWERGVPIGRPINNTEAFVLDERGQLLPVGVVGELYLGGEGLARGYVGDAAQTAEKFVPHAFAKRAGERLYRTGDLVRWRADGELEFVGRVDEQVKLRGYRIEPGEIEQALREHEAVQDAVVVVVRSSEDEEKRLIAYVVAEASVGDLRAHLRERLPEYMAPWSFEYLERLPLNANGKVDRDALPEPASVASSSEGFVGPRTATEEMLCGIWSEVLRVERVGVHDNFFELGGDSILSIQIIAKIQERGFGCSIQDLFERPEIAELAALLDQRTTLPGGQGRLANFSLLSEEDRRRLPEEIEDAYPLARLQAGMIFHSEYAPNTAVYHDLFSYHLNAPLDVDAMRATIQELIRRHAVLRTSFAVSGYSEPLQLVHHTARMPVEVQDVSSLSESEQRRVIQQTVETEKNRDFQWTQPPLMRLLLHKRSAESFQFTLSFHHVLLDGWSLAALLTEWFQHYWRLLGNEASEVAAMPVWSYGEFLKLERAAIASEECQNYWRAQIEQSQLTQLPRLRFDKPAIEDDGEQEFWISRSVTDQLKKLSQKHGLPMKSILLAAHMRVLAVLSGQRNVTSGLVWHGRPEESSAERMIGLFLNTLPFVMEMERGSWLDLAQRAFAKEREMIPHKRYPLNEVQRSQGGAALFEVAFNYIHFHVFQDALQLPGIRILETQANTKTNFPLLVNFGLDPSGGNLQLAFQYDSGEFSREQIRQFAGCYERALQAIASDPERDYRESSLVDPAEAAQELNQAREEYELEGTSLASWFEEVAARRDEAVAVVCGDEQLSYRELNEQANRLAHYLRKRGVGPEQLVGVYLERSARMVVSLLGIVKAGGAYVPVDLEYPPERVNYMLADAGVKVVLSETAVAERLSEWAGEVVRIDADWVRVSEESGANPATANSSENVAYVIYTSGTTGKPKGTLVTHGNVQRLLQSTEGWYGFGEDDVWTLFHSYGFDFSVWEMWGALLYGGRLVVVPYLVSRMPEQFYELLQREGVTVLNQTPSAFWQLQAVALAGTERLKLRLVIFGGEALAVSRLREWYEFHEDGGPKLVNMYGITETTVHVSYRELSVADVTAGGSPIGCALPDLELYVLDEELQPAPLGVLGELYVGGSGVSRGYLNRPELTATRFVPHPYSGRAGERLYRSGDQARRLANGDIEYLGRLDQQVKIRGFRIELGEIETVLRQHPGIREAVVLARQDEGETEKRLVGYLVPNGAQNLTNEDLRQYLKGQLAEYMVPAAFVALEQLPLTAQGKIDRRALPAPEARRPRLAESYEAPRTWQEKELAEIWSQCLGVEPIGIHDNFFALGGDSIRSVRVRAQAQDAGISFSLEALFKHPTIHELVQHLDSGPHVAPESSQEPFALLPAEERNLPENVEDAYPLTMLQAGMFFHNEYSPGDALYHNIMSLSVEAPFEADCWRQALQSVADRHHVLRTSFVMDGNSEPIQVVRKHVEVPLTIDDIRNLSLSEKQDRISSWFESEKNRSFDLRHAPVWRAHVHLSGDDAFVLSITEHHSILDGWSATTLLNELFTTYLALLKGDSQHRRGPARNIFRDYVAAEREIIGSDECRRFWLDELHDMTFTPLPRWSWTTSESPGERKDHDVLFSAELSEGLKELSQRLSVPVKSVLLAAHLRVLSVLSNQEDIVTGVVTSNRLDSAGSYDALGLFLNTIPFRQRLTGGSWADLIRKVFETEARVLPFQRYPLKQMQEVSQGQIAFETAFNFTHFHVFGELFAVPELKVLGAKHFAKTNFPLLVNFGLDPNARRIQMTLQYENRQITQEQVRQIEGAFKRVLEAMLSEPESDYRSIALISDEEWSNIQKWNQTAIEFPRGSSIAEQFELQVEKRPEATALISGSERLSYRELNERANQLAHYLKEQGVGADVVVGVCQERTVALIVSLLGIMKAGGAYLPMDPDVPLSRREYMLTQASARLVLSELPEQLHEQSKENMDRQSTGDNLAYVMYTSGSTGRPKGVCVTQANVLRLVHDPNYVKLDHDSVILQLTANTFDVATFEIWGALLHGGRLVLFPGRVASGDDLREVIRKEGIETLWLTSALYSGVVESGVEALTGVKQLLVGGEALPVKQVREGVARLPETEFINGYGPTEVTTFSCTHRVRSTAGESWERGVPIGRPVNNTECYVLDERGQLLPVGVVGELYLGGEGLARGYVGDAAQTAEKFVPHPYARSAGERLYRTGDLVRWRSDGELEFIGRVDEQVKLRGYRIEPGEIEQALREHKAVQDTIVVIREDETEGKRLVAYVVADAASASVNDLRAHLRERLPEYMVPSSFEYLERLPLNANGKVDREALPAPVATRESSGEYLPPRTPTEEILANVWSQVLGVNQVGINDNFFQLGGHSLTAMKIVGRLRKTFEIELPLRDFFESPTLAELAQRVDNARRTSSTEIPLVPVSRDQLLPLSFGQQRFWFLSQLQIDNSPYNLATAVRLRGSLDIEALENTFSEIVRRHEILRTTFHEIDGHAAQLISPPQRVKLFVDDLGQLPDAQRDRVLKRRLDESANQRFELTKGPLFKPELIALGPDDHVLSLTMHHIISDGWSIEVFVRELVVLYDAYVNRRKIDLPELPIQYADFAHWQRAMVEGPEQTAQLDYWRRRLGGELPLLNLPTDRPRPEIPTYRGAMEQFVLDAEVMKQIRALSQREGVTLFMSLLAAWKVLLHRYTGQVDVITGSVIANRNHHEVEPLMGFFVNTLVLRTDLSGNPVFTELLRRVRDVCLSAYSNQDLPFERLVEVLRPQRRANDIPLFEVMFALQTAGKSSVELPGLSLTMMDPEIQTTPFDLSMSLVDGGEGFLGVIRYSTDLFDVATIRRLVEHYQNLLNSIAAHPDRRIGELEIYSESEKQQQVSEKTSRKDSRLRKLRDVKLKSVELSPQSLVNTEYFDGTKLPLVIQPKVEGVNLVTWTRANSEFIEQEILKHGSILFRNFGLDSLSNFELFASALSPSLMTYSERSSPRTQLGAHVYTSTTHPPDQSIHLHNEHSYTLQWPMRLWFYCVQPAPQGGRTPIADTRNILRRIDPEIVNRFIEKKILYVRNYGDGLGLPWQEVFQTSDRSTVEEYCRRNGINVQWKNGNRLRTTQVRPAVRRHAKSGALVWFNHAAFFHISNLEEATRRSTLEVLGEDELPFNTFYGDGSPIESPVLENIRDAYRQETVSFQWLKGDILMLDNMLVAHGRESFSGPRQVVFIMADQIENPGDTEQVDRLN